MTKHMPVLVVLALVLGCVPSQSRQSAQPLGLTLENIYGPRGRAGGSEISPDGRYVAVSAMGPQGSGIYLVPTAAHAPTTGTFWAEGGSPSWFPNSDRIVFRRGADLWTIAIGSSEPAQITSDDENERAPRVSPDSNLVAFYSGRSGYQDIWVVPADGSAEPRQVTFDAFAPDDFRWSPAWSPDSRRIAYVSNTADYWHDDIWVVDIETLDTRQVSRTLMASTEPVWSPDGTEIALLGTHKDGYWYEDLADIFVLDPAAGTERTVDMQIHATDWLHRMRIFWSGDGERILFPYHERGDFDLWSVPSQGGVATRVTNMGGSLGSLSSSSGAEIFAFTRATPTRGSDVDLIPSAGGTLQRLTNFAAEWNTVVDPVEISFRSYDGLYIQGFLYMPPDHTPGERHPALVQVHGGGTNSYLHGENLFEQYLASKGYVVLAVNYRGGSGFGREFQDLGVNDWANGQARDAAAAGEFLRTQDYTNGKVGIYGYSYGGITSMAAITRVPGVFDAAVPMAGIYDFGDAYTNADRIGRIFIKTGHSGSPEEQPEIYAVSNTLARIENIDTPLLIMHGELDVRAPYRQFEIAVAELERHGKVFESRSYPGETHGLRPAARIDMYTRAEEFFDRMLKGENE
ncbi:MAG: prolyl oligopeptidase family serine peptidase [Gemmatimonadota bacterium]|nr:prolyl oligopeptidase family serine peptidase [Gemmatimonadota bacterium]